MLGVQINNGNKKKLKNVAKLGSELLENSHEVKKITK